MKKEIFERFTRKIINKRDRIPLFGHLDLTYRCNLNCVHCYCKGSEDKGRELDTNSWKKIIEEAGKSGCLWLTLSGGEPLIREDFWEIYSFAKEKGFLLTLFTNGLGLNKKIIKALVKSTPVSIEITLESIVRQTYEAITRVKGSFGKVIENIKLLKESKLPFIIKSNCLKQNFREIFKIKIWVEDLLGKSYRTLYRFRYGESIFPRLSGDKTPCDFRVEPEDLLAVKRLDPDIWQEHKSCLRSKPKLIHGRKYLYQCDSWTMEFIVDPYGIMKPCLFSDKFSVDLKTTDFREGFYKIFPKIWEEEFKTDSKCKDCSLRPFCGFCPAKAYLETGNEEGPVDYFCRKAEAFMRESQQLGKGSRKTRLANLSEVTN